MNTNMIIVAILVLRFLVKLRFPASTPISSAVLLFQFSFVSTDPRTFQLGPRLFLRTGCSDSHKGLIDTGFKPEASYITKLCS